MDFKGILMAYQQQNFPLKAGNKIVLKNTLVRRGALCLDAENVCILGGSLEHDGQSQILRELIGFPTIISTSAAPAGESKTNNTNRAINAAAAPVVVGRSAPAMAANSAAHLPHTAGSSNAQTNPIVSYTSASKSRPLPTNSSHMPSHNSSSSGGGGAIGMTETISLISQPTSESIYEDDIPIEQNKRQQQYQLQLSSSRKGIAAAEEEEMDEEEDHLYEEEEELLAMMDVFDPPTTSASSAPKHHQLQQKQQQQKHHQPQPPSILQQQKGRLQPQMVYIRSFLSPPPPLSSVVSRSPNAPRCGIIRGFASRVYRCKLHTRSSNSSKSSSSATNTTNTTALTRHFLRSYAAQSSIATSNILLEIIMDFHDGMHSVPVILHPHVACRFLHLHFSNLHTTRSYDEEVAQDSAVLTTEDILSCFQFFQGIFLVTEYPLLQQLPTAATGASTAAAVLSNEEYHAFHEGIADEIRHAGDRFQRKFYQQQQSSSSSSSAGNSHHGSQLTSYGSQSQQSQYYPPTTHTSSSANNTSSSPAGGSSGASGKMLMLLDLVTSSTSSAAASAAARTGFATVEDLIRQKMAVFPASS